MHHLNASDWLSEMWCNTIWAEIFLFDQMRNSAVLNERSRKKKTRVCCRKITARWGYFLPFKFCLRSAQLLVAALKWLTAPSRAVFRCVSVPIPLSSSSFHLSTHSGMISVHCSLPSHRPRADAAEQHCWGQQAWCQPDHHSAPSWRGTRHRPTPTRRTAETLYPQHWWKE